MKRKLACLFFTAHGAGDEISMGVLVVFNVSHRSTGTGACG